MMWMLCLRWNNSTRLYPGCRKDTKAQRSKDLNFDIHWTQSGLLVEFFVSWLISQLINSQMLTVAKGFLWICCSTIISFLLSITVDMHNYELNGLINYFWPPIVGTATTIIFLLSCWITKRSNRRIVVLSLCCLYLIYVGIALHYEKEYWPLVLI